MKVTISGYGGSVSGGQTAPTTIEWPFDFPPALGMTIKWTDSATNPRKGKVDTVTFDLDGASASITAAVS